MGGRGKSLPVALPSTPVAGVQQADLKSFLRLLLNETRLSPPPLNESHDSLYLPHKYLRHIWRLGAPALACYQFGLTSRDLHASPCPVILLLNPQSVRRDKDLGLGLILWKPVCHILGPLRARSCLRTNTPRARCAPVKTLPVSSGHEPRCVTA